VPGRRGPGGFSGGPSGSSGGGSSTDRTAPIDTTQLDELAPLPGAPALYPPGSDYVVFPVTFEIEIIPEDQRGAAANQQAAADADGDQA
jgi:hypothetical protein